VLFRSHHGPIFMASRQIGRMVSVLDLFRLEVSNHG
jgi:hypothetical protein